MRHALNCHVIHDIDLFGKEPELYYKGKNKKSVLIGRIFTIMYILIYIAFFLYKLIRMLQKVDVTFFQNTAFTGEVPSIHLTNKIFYGGFAFANAQTLQPFIDESIYSISLQFRTGHRVNNVWNWKVEPIELEVCQLEKFDPRYYDLFKDKPMGNMYCPKTMDVVLQGHTTYDVYSYFYVGFYPCVNTTTKQNCKSEEEIDKLLKNVYVSFKMQDIELTPQIYSTPVQLRGKEVNSPASKYLFQNINAYFQVIEIETENDIVGFEALSNIKKEKYLKYDGPIVLSRLNDYYTQYISGRPLCDVTVQLTEQVLTIKRTYTKLIEVLGDVGGLMEVFFMFFKMFSSIITDILYEKSMVNNLFNFDLDKKLILMKDLKKKKKRNYRKKTQPEEFKEDLQVYNIKRGSSSKIFSQKSIYTNEDLTIQTRNKLNNEDLLKSDNKLTNSNFLSSIKSPRKKRKKIRSSNFKDKDNIYNIEEIKNIDNSNEVKKEDKEKIKKTEKDIKETKTLRTKTKKSENSKTNIINKIKLNKIFLCFCFCCARKTKNIKNILIEEGMYIITDHLDVLNIFKKLYRDGKIQEKLQNPEDDSIRMSDECTKQLSNIKMVLK